MKRYNLFNYGATWIGISNIIVAAFSVYVMLLLHNRYSDQLVGLIFGWIMTAYLVIVCLARAVKYIRKGIVKAYNCSDDFLYGRIKPDLSKYRKEKDNDA